MNRSCRLWFVPVFLLQAGFFWFVSQHRLIDVDEGFYLLASRLVLQHKAPYLDFFYTQAPLLPYVYAAWLKLAGISWFSARVFCALLTAVVGGLLYDHVCRETGKWLAGVSAVVLFASAAPDLRMVSHRKDLRALDAVSVPGLSDCAASRRLDAGLADGAGGCMFRAKR